MKEQQFWQDIHKHEKMYEHCRTCHKSDHSKCFLKPPKKQQLKPPGPLNAGLTAQLAKSVGSDFDSDDEYEDENGDVVPIEKIRRGSYCPGEKPMVLKKKLLTVEEKHKVLSDRQENNKRMSKDMYSIMDRIEGTAKMALINAETF